MYTLVKNNDIPLTIHNWQFSNNQKHMISESTIWQPKQTFGPSHPILQMRLYHYPYHPCMVLIFTSIYLCMLFTYMLNVGKYIPYVDAMGQYITLSATKHCGQTRLLSTLLSHVTVYEVDLIHLNQLKLWNHTQNGSQKLGFYRQYLCWQDSCSIIVCIFKNTYIYIYIYTIVL